MWDKQIWFLYKCNLKFIEWSFLTFNQLRRCTFFPIESWHWAMKVPANYQYLLVQVNLLICLIFPKNLQYCWCIDFSEEYDLPFPGSGEKRGKNPQLWWVNELVSVCAVWNVSNIINKMLDNHFSLPLNTAFRPKLIALVLETSNKHDLLRRRSSWKVGVLEEAWPGGGGSRRWPTRGLSLICSAPGACSIFFNSSPENESRLYFRLSVNGVTNTMDIDSGEGEGVFR